LCINEILPFSSLDSEPEFYSTISGARNTLIDHLKLNEIKLGLKFDLISSPLTIDDDLDADINYYNVLLNNPAKYCETADINNISVAHKCNDPQFFMHINARSLHKNLEHIITELSLLTYKPSIIAVTETWALSDNDCFPIPGYTSILKARRNKPGGGVSLYIQNTLNLKHKLRPDLSIDDGTDSLFIQLKNDKLKNMIIGVIYKPPDADVIKFNENLEQFLKLISKEHKPCYLLGDYNINLLKQDKHLPTKHFLDTLLTYGFYPLINRPTRITTNSTTLIDNILTNVHDVNIRSGIWIADISDHLPVFTILPNKTCKSPTKVKIRKQHNLENVEKFKGLLQNCDWSDVYNCQSANSMYNKFIHRVQCVYDISFPFITKTIKASEEFKPWITRAIKNSIRKKNSLYKDYLKLKTEKSHSTYKTYRNKLTAILRKSEKSYYLQKLQSVKDNLAKTWKILNSITSRKKPQVRVVDEIVCHNNIISDPTLIANKFNNFFANVGSELAKKIPPVSENFEHFLPLSNPNSIFLNPTDDLEVKQIILALKNSYSKGHDNLSVNTIKNCSDQLAGPLSMIFNKSIEEGIIPDDLKIAKITPVYKSDDKKTVSNYRPISVLPAFSKILERLVYNRLLDFINKYDILSQNQFGFRKNISTSMALLELVDNISNSIEKNEHTIGIFLDLAKAFDTVNHNILLKKLHHYGIRGNAYDWFENYLNNRHQYVHLNGIQSSKLLVTCGVPQGSILGPLLFLLYINDLNTVSKLLTFIMFADDTNIFISGKSLDNITTKINAELTVVSTWFSANLLSLNVKKTNYILFGNKKPPDVSITIGSEKILRVFHTKFLGVIIQSDLKWNTHINSLTNKISKTIGVINKIKHILATAHLKMLYQSLIEPYLNYCCVVWASPEKSSVLETLLKLQKRSVRIILFVPYRDHSQPLFHKLNILNIYDLCLAQILIYVYKSVNYLLPNQCIKYFTRTKDIHPYSTRGHEHNLYLTNAKKTCRTNSITFRGPKYWKMLSDNIRSATSLKMFKTRLKNYLIDKYVVSKD
jgi:hypothetical protein